MKKVTLLNVEIDNISWEETLGQISLLIEKRQPSFIVTPNVDHIVRYRKSENFRAIYARAALVLADGMPLLWAGRFLGTPIQCKISGSDLLPEVAALAARRQYRLYLLGGRKGAAEQAATILQQRYPGLKVAGHYCPPFGFEHDPKELAAIDDRLREAKPDILFVGLGSPKQENWIATNYERLGIPVSIGVGVSFEFISGMVRRAPKWMQRHGLEWLWRLGMEPRRLWRRYLIEDMVFFTLVMKEKFGGK